MKDKKDVGEGIEELLIRLRNEKGWSRVELMTHLSNKEMKEKEVKKWEIGLKYPDLDTIYELSEIYGVPSSDFIQAKNNSYVKGLGAVNMFLIKWICYFLDVSMKVGMALTMLFYAFMLIFSLWFFVLMAESVKG